MSVAAIALSTLLDRGLLDYYAYNGGEAYRTYTQAAAAYPTAAMAYWGEALALGPNINEPLTRDDFERAQSAIAKAVALAATSSQRDRDLIDALSKRFAGGWDRRLRDDLDYRSAMAALVEKYPSDDTVAMLHAEAIADGNGDWSKVAALAAAVLARDPQHPMANHLCVHAYDDAADRSPAIACAKRLDAMTFEPAQEHLAHMPAHTWIETGAYAAAMASSERGYALIQRYADLPDADLTHERYAGHDVGLGFTAAMFLGNYARALRWEARGAQGASPAQVMVRFGRWTDILAATDATDTALPVAKVLAHAHVGDFDLAEAAFDRLTRAQKDSSLGVLAQSRLWEHVGRVPDAIKALRGLAKQQFENYGAEYLPPIPAIEALAALELRSGTLEDAIAAYRETLARYPNDPRALYGLGIALEKAGRSDESATMMVRYLHQWDGADTTLSPDDL